MIDFRTLKTTRRDVRLISRIATRAQGLHLVDIGGGYPIDRLSLVMDLEATHAVCCPLRLNDLLDATDSDFVHDIVGIHSHLDRDTGELSGCFVPRYAD